jgi:hypothetical protein
VVSDDRTDRLSIFTPPASASTPQTAADAVIGSTDVRSASFEVGGLTLELVATTAIVSLSVLAGADRDGYRLDASALDHWADATARLLALSTATGLSACAEFRAPFLMDAEGRASIAFESAVTQGGVVHRLLVMRHDGRVATIVTADNLLRELIDAARGAAAFVRSGSSESR